jgi:hypothetical protein
VLAEFGWPEKSMIEQIGIQAALATEMHMQLYFTLVGIIGGKGTTSPDPASHLSIRFLTACRS